METCCTPQRPAQCRLISRKEDKEEEENGTFGLFNMTSVPANLSDVYPPLG